MKSAQVIQKPRLDEMIHELCHQKLDGKKTKNWFKADDRVHARMVAKTKSRKYVEKWIDNISIRLN